MNALLVVAFALAAPGDEVNLKWKLKEGDTFYAKNRVVLEQTLTVMGKDVEQSTMTDTVVRYKVKTVTRTSTVVEMTYLSNKVAAKGLPGADAVNDKLKGVTVTATLNAKMEVTKLEGYDKVLDALAGDDKTARAQLKVFMPEDILKQMFAETFGVTPPNPVQIGDTWKRSDKVPFAGSGTVTTSSTFKLDQVKGGVATVSWKGTGVFKIGESELPGLPVKLVKANLKSEKLTGTYTFDVPTGRVKESKMEMVMAGSMTFEGGGKEIDIDAKQKLTQSSVISDKNPIRD
ncbi:MAG: DUF6263 family protein [Planctomycetia bacterium]|nr:DUF6263 family protein [Planctomycetia bacterium]